MMVKICGITNREDALAAVEGGASALGFNFYSGSPRYISPENAAELIVRLPAAVWKVGVFVNESPARVGEIATLAGLDVAQLHGDEKPVDSPDGLRVWKAARVDRDFAIASIDACAAEAVLLDSPVAGLFGGTGQTFDWRLAVGSKKKIIIAGGLDSHNVRQAIRAAQPWGVDTCSGIESAPGKKDHAKMAEFLKVALSNDPDLRKASLPSRSP